MKSKILALFLALVMILASVPYSFAAGSYNRSKAVAYAKEHWKDDKGQCAEFVSDCLKAGGSNAWNRTVKPLLDKLNGQGTLYSVADGTTSYNNWKLNKSACSFDVKPGDLVFFYCKTCANAGKSGYCHVAIIIGFDSKGNIVCAQHNGAIGYYDTIRGFGHYNTNVDKKKHEGSAISLKIFHMNDDGASISSLVKALPAPPSKVVSKWTLSVSDNTGTSATLKADVTCTPANVYKIGLEIGTSSSNMKSVASRNVGSSLTSYSVKCDGSAGPKLTAGTTYYYRFYIQRIDGKNEYSSTSSFTAKAGGSSTPPPAATNAVSKWTLSVSGITTNSATVRADITCTPSKLSKVGLELGTSSGNMKSVVNWKVGNVLTYCTVKCDGSEGPKLSPGTTYYYRFYVLRTDGKYEYSSTGNFTTKSNTCTSHTYDKGTVTTAATCTAAGTIVYKCTKCGASKTETVKAKGHTAGSWTVTKQPQVGVKGTETQKCTVCSAVLATREIAALAPSNAVTKWTLSVSGITTDSATVRADITCTPSKLSKVGLELGTSSGNMKSVASWKVGTILTFCSVKCDGSEGPKLSPGTTYYYRFYVLRTDGKYEYSTTGNFTTKSNACTSHTYNSGTVTVNPTCTAAGTIVYKCTKCGASKTEAVKAKGHTAQVLPGKAATCNAPGLTEGSKCSVCNAVIKAQTTIPAKGHSVQVLPGKTATCTAPGLSEGSKCSVCNAVIKAQTAIPAKGHKAGAWTVTKQPQVGVKGTETQKCTVCSAVLATREIAALSSFLPGDVDRDGQITATDARLVLRIAVALDRVNAEVYRIADFNGDGTVTADDARSVLRRAVGLG